MNGLNPAVSNISHHDKNSAKFLFHAWISINNWPNGRGSPDAWNDRVMLAKMSNSQPSMSILSISMCLCPTNKQVVKRFVPMSDENWEGWYH